MRKLIVLFLLLALVVIAWQMYESSLHHKASVAASVSVVSHTDKTGAAFLYPDPKLTPGDVVTTDSSVVCRLGYSESVRHVPRSEKQQVFREYGVSYPVPRGSYEVDHFISLELGGSNDLKNLWPEPASPTPGFHEKDVVENYLHRQVCNGKISLAQAQKEISTDWYAVYLNVHRG